MSARPISPHLSAYRFGYTMLFSILHRITGLILSVGLLVLAWWLMALANGPAAYAIAETFLLSWFAKTLLAGWLASFCYHLCNGIRHLTWDLGVGMEKQEARRSAWAAIVAALVLFAALGYLAIAPASNAHASRVVPQSAR